MSLKICNADFKKKLNFDWKNITVENNIYGVFVVLNEFNRDQSFLNL